MLDNQSSVVSGLMDMHELDQIWAPFSPWLKESRQIYNRLQMLDVRLSLVRI